MVADMMCKSSTMTWWNIRHNSRGAVQVNVGIVVVVVVEAIQTHTHIHTDTSVQSPHRYHFNNHQTTDNGWFVVFLNILSVHKHNKRSSSSRAPSNQTINTLGGIVLLYILQAISGIWLRCGNHIKPQSIARFRQDENVYREKAHAKWWSKWRGWRWQSIFHLSSNDYGAGENSLTILRCSHNQSFSCCFRNRNGRCLFFSILSLVSWCGFSFSAYIPSLSLIARLSVNKCGLLCARIKYLMLLCELFDLPLKEQLWRWMWRFESKERVQILVLRM